MRPPIFADLSFEAALEASKRDKKMLLVDASASWCQPCKHMDATTWVDGKVTERIREGAIAIQIDVDEQKELSKKLKIRAMPTVIAFHEGKELDRVVGMRAPPQLLEWMDAIARGETSLDAARAAARAKPNDGQARMAFARMLLEQEKLDEATTEHVDLWTALDANPAFGAIKHSFFKQQVGELVEVHPPAREAFTRLRNVAEPGSLDWLTLNGVLNENERTLSWYESVRGRLETDDKLAQIVEQIVIPIFVDSGRWADAGHAYAHPTKTLERIIEQRTKVLEGLSRVPEEQRAQAKAMFGQMMASAVEILRRALFEAKREDELRAVDEAAAKVDPAWVTPLPK
jgi:thiol-disulfide isomerase/thioredoxin